MRTQSPLAVPRWRALIGAALSLLVFAGELAAQEEEHHGPSHAAAEQGVTAVLEAAFAATEARDYAALDTLYAEEATIVEGTGIDRGWASYRDHHLKPELERFRDFVYRPRNIEAHVGERWAWAHFEYDLELAIEGRQIDHVGRGTAVLSRRDGGWVIRHMQTTSEPAENGGE